MADTEQKAILTIELNSDELIKKSAALKKEIESINQTQKEARTVANLTNKQTKEQAQQYQVNEARLRELKKELRENNSVIDKNRQAVKSAKGSNDQLRATLSVLTRQYNLLSKEERENTKAGQDLGKQIRSISDELKENESAVGDNRRNVGNYSDALSGLGGRLGSTIRSITTLTTAAETNAAAMSGMAASASVSSGAMAALRAGTLKAITAVRQLTAASIRFILTPLGAIIAAIAIAISSLIAFFTKAQSGIEGFDKATRVVSTVVDVFVDRLILLGSALVNLFTLDFEGFASDATAAFSGITDEIIRETQAAAKLEEQLKALERAENDQIITGEIRKAQIAELRLAAKDENRTLEDRLDLLNKARELIKQNTEAEIKLQEGRIAQTLGITDENELRKALNKVIDEGNQLKLEEIGLSTSTEEDRKEANEQIAELIRLRKLSADEQRTIASEQVSLIRRSAREREKVLKAEQQIIEKTRQSYQSLTKSFIDFEQRQLAFLGRNTQERLKLLERQRDLELEILSDKFEKQRDALEKSGASEAAIRKGLIDLQIQEQQELTVLIANFEQDRIEIQKQAAEDLSNARSAILDTIEKNSLSANEREIRESQEKYDALYQQLVDARTQQAITEDEFRQAELELIAQQEAEETKIKEEQEKTRTENEKAEADKRRKIAQAELQGKVDLITSLSEVVSQAAGEQTQGAKAIATVAALSNTYAAINKTLAEPTLPFPSNVLTSTLIGAKGLLNVRNIQSLSKGGEAGGKPHSQGGTKYYGEDGHTVELERGEKWFVLNKNSSRMIDGLSSLNVSGGGVPFSDGSQRRTFQDGGVVERSVSLGVDQDIQFNDLLQAVINRPVQVSVEEIRSVNNRVEVRERTGSF
jgi:hypothetical protein